MNKPSLKKSAAVCSVAAIISIVLSMDSGLRTNNEGLELIGNSEACRREPYLCPARVLTAGIGSTTGIVRNHKYSDQEIADMWITDIRIAEKCVNKYAGGSAMTDNQFSAVTSFAFNAGCGNLQKSTLAKKANAGDFTGMCDELTKWVYAGGKKLGGLVKRREKERELCLS